MVKYNSIFARLGQILMFAIKIILISSNRLIINVRYLPMSIELSFLNENCVKNIYNSKFVSDNRSLKI